MFRSRRRSEVSSTIRENKKRRQTQTKRRLLLEQLEDRRLLAGSVTKIDVNASGASNPSDFVLFNNALYFAADDAAAGRELFKLDTAGTVTRVTDINTSGSSLTLGQAWPAVYNSELYFQADDGTNGAELWKLTTSDTASLVANINSGAASSNPSYLTEFNSALYFQADDGSSGAELFKYDGTSATLAADINSSGGSSPAHLTVFSNALHFRATAGMGFQLFKFTDSPATWTDLTSTNMLGTNPSWLVHNGSLYFQGSDVSVGVELFQYDTVNPVTLAAEINPNNSGLDSSYPQHLHVFNGELYLQADDGSTGAELWKYNGSAASLVANINSGGSSSPQYLAEYGGELFFQADDGTGGAELWKYNSSTTTATQAADINAAGSSAPQFLIAFNGALYFSADAGSDRELYMYGDATADFGDAPDTGFGTGPGNYQTLLSDAGASHTATGPKLGANREVELNGQPSTGAVDDDNNGGPDDEDGVTISNSFTIATSGTARATISASGGVLDAWLDFNGDGDWLDANEQIATNVVMSAGINHVDFAVPAGATVGTTYARFRIASAAGDVTTPTGAATNGEVEDYRVTISVPTDVYVDDDWAPGGSSPKAPGDSAGPGVFGYNAFGTIQAGLNAVATTGVVNVAAGTYVENLTVDKPLSLLGPNAAINPNTGSRVAEAVVVPATSDPDPYSSGAVTIVYVEAGNVTIKGFTVDGNNPLINSGVLVKGVDVDAAEGINSYEGVGQITVENNIVTNISYAGIDFYNWSNPAATASNYIRYNKLDNIGHIPYGLGIGVIVYNNFYADVTQNVMTDVRVGVQTGNFYLANPGTTASISNNQIASTRRGIFHNLAYSSASPFTISGNTLTVADEAGGSPGPTHTKCYVP